MLCSCSNREKELFKEIIESLRLPKQSCPWYRLENRSQLKWMYTIFFITHKRSNAVLNKYLKTFSLIILMFCKTYYDYKICESHGQ